MNHDAKTSFINTSHNSDSTHYDHDQSRLYPEDQERVDRYLQEGINKIERPAFRPLRLMAWLTGVIILIGALSRIIGYFVIPS